MWADADISLKNRQKKKKIVKMSKLKFENKMNVGARERIDLRIVLFAPHAFVLWHFSAYNLYIRRS